MTALAMEFSDDEDLLPQFTDQVPSLAQYDCREVEDVDKFLTFLEEGSGSTAPFVHKKCAPGSDIALAQAIANSSAQSFKASKERLQLLKVQQQEMTRTANKCKKTISSVTETRRSATEAIKRLNAETQHVLDDDIDNDTLQAIESKLTEDVDAAATSDSIQVKCATSYKHGLEIQKNGNDFKIVYQDDKFDAHRSFCVSLRKDENNHYAVVESSHEDFGPMNELLSQLNHNADKLDWNLFYANLRKALDTNPVVSEENGH
jgi:vacuolar-type H+-ATPase subunit I/STV1